MKTDFRNRAFLPVVLPLAILGFIGSLVIGFALILLWNTREAALVLASVAAGGVLVTVALASSQEKMDSPKAGVIAMAGGLPVLVGLLFAFGLFVDVDDSELNINRVPHVAIPDGALVIGAEDPNAFDATMITVPADEEVTVAFDNRNVGVQHNWVLYTDDSLAEEITSTGPPSAGPNETFTTFQVAVGDYYFLCIVHPNMNGVLVAEAGATPAIS